MKKILLITSAVALLSTGLMAQNSVGKSHKKNFSKATKSVTVQNHSQPSAKDGQLSSRGCGTKIPTKQWDESFNKLVEKHKQDIATNRTTASTYTIPIIFHIIYSTGEAVGSGHNLSQAQVNSQIPVLNADYNGTGFNHSNYASCTLSGHPAFYDYAVSAALPAPDAGGVVIASSGITFCLATKNPSGTTLAEPGIDRVTWESISGATDPASSNVQTLMDGTIKPATIWDPTKYFNVWTSDGGSSGLLGYATFPPLTASTGVFNSQGEGVSSVSTTDGVWICYTSCGTTGNVASPYQYGRTLTHESGHYFGLRHIWGDGSCVTDYCNDTPPAGQANYVSCPTAYPYEPNSCSGTPPAGNGPDGDMFMNFMDYSDDCAMYMFTTDQVSRFQTALANSPWRSGLTASAANLCVGLTVSTPTASFNPPSSICVNQPASFTDVSSGPPTSWNWSVSPSTGVTITTNTVSGPNITFPSAGTYTVTDAVSNSAGNSSISQTVAVGSCTVNVTCPDTLTNFKNTDTITIFRSTSGYVSGNNNYGDLEKGEFYAGTGLPANPKVTGGIILYFKDVSANQGTMGTSAININMYSGVTNTTGGGPSSAAVATKSVSISTITALTPVMGVPYCGDPTLGFSSAIIYPYDFNFSSPVNITGGFILSTTLPPNGTDTVAVFMTSGTTASASTAWEKQSDNTWHQFNDGTNATWQINASLAILPKISCTTGIDVPNSIANHIAMFPNPSDGNVNFVVTMPETTDLTFNVINTLGQTVITRVEKSVNSNIINLDLSNQAKGIYYINIVCEKSSMVLKAIIR